MPIDPSLPFRILQPPTAINPDDLPGGVNWQAKRAEADALKLKTQQQRQDFLDQQQIRQVAQQSGGDLDAMHQKLLQVNPMLGMKFGQELQGIKSDAMKFQEHKMDYDRKVFGDLADVNDQAEYDKKLAALKLAKYDISTLPTQFTPETKKQFEERSLTTSERLQRETQRISATSQAAARLAEIENKAEDNRRAHELEIARIQQIKDQTERDKARGDALERYRASQLALEKEKIGIERIKANKQPATGTVIVQTDQGPQIVNKGTGTATPIKDQSGAVVKGKQSATLEARTASAQAVNQTGEDIIAKLNDPKYRSQVGVAMGRYNTLKDFIGNPPPEYAELAGMIESYALANMGVHGMRSVQGAEQIKKLLEQRHTPESLIATIRGLNAFSQRFMETQGKTAPSATPKSGTVGKYSFTVE